MSLKIMNYEECEYEIVSLGEVLLRLDPGNNRIRTAREFCVWEGGGEYNVARALKKCFGMRAGVVTALAENDIGFLIEDLIMQGGVDTSMILWKKYDGIGRSVRNGINFTERGFGVRGALGISDRANTAASQMEPGDLDWDELFGNKGVRWFHTGGIFAGLSPSTASVVIEAVKKAKEYGTIVSYDLNYRPSLWKSIGGIDKAREVNQEIAQYIDVMIGNEEDFTACLGLKIEGYDPELKSLDINSYERMMKNAVIKYPNFKLIASSLRTVITASKNGWSGLCYTEGKIYKGINFPELEIFDRVGGGDSFASGLIYGLITTGNPQLAVNYGVAHGALAMTTPGDTSMAKVYEVEALMRGKRARVQR